MRGLTLWIAVLASAFLLAGCDREEKRRQWEAQRVKECLDKFCEGDIEPTRNMATEVALKLYGQWYIGPKVYFSTGKNGGGFYWPSRHPMFAGGVYLESGQDFPDKAIDVFLTGRQRWPDPKAPTPWAGRVWEGRFEKLREQGLRMERTTWSPSLEIVRFYHPDGKQYRRAYYIATQQRRLRGDGPPIASCDSGTHPDYGCTGGTFMSDDIFADFRFNARHAQDWPEIYQEITRVLQQLRKAQQ